MNFQIANCPHHDGCPQQWAALQDTGLPLVRLCPECSRNVLACENETEQRAAMEDGRIFALPTGSVA